MSSEGPDLLRENEERLRLALTGTNLGVYDLDLRTGRVVFSPEYATILGYDPAGFDINIDRWTEAIHPDDRDHVVGIAAVVPARRPAALLGRVPHAHSGRPVEVDPVGREDRLGAGSRRPDPAARSPPRHRRTQAGRNGPPREPPALRRARVERAAGRVPRAAGAGWHLHLRVRQRPVLRHDWPAPGSGAERTRRDRVAHRPRGP